MTSVTIIAMYKESVMLYQCLTRRVYVRNLCVSSYRPCIHATWMPICADDARSFDEIVCLSTLNAFVPLHPN